MKNNKYYTELVSVFSAISENEISSRDKLQMPCNQNIYAELWFATQNFINYFALASKSHRSSKGGYVVGNAEKVRTLVSRGIELEDIRRNILTHVLNKMDYILAQPIEKQINYTYHVINNCVYDEFRKLPPADVAVVSLHDKIKGKNVSTEDTTELQDFISDHTTPEDEIVARETLNEILMTRKAKVLDEITLLASKPAEIFVRLCSKHLDMKPAAIANLLFEKGVTASFATVLMLVSDKYDIPLDMIRNHLTNKAITEEAVKLDTNDESKVSAQISRLVYRADKRLKKQTYFERSRV